MMGKLVMMDLINRLQLICFIASTLSRLIGFLQCSYFVFTFYPYSYSFGLLFWSFSPTLHQNLNSWIIGWGHVWVSTHIFLCKSASRVSKIIPSIWLFDQIWDFGQSDLICELNLNLVWLSNFSSANGLFCAKKKFSHNALFWWTGLWSFHHPPHQSNPSCSA